MGDRVSGFWKADWCCERCHVSSSATGRRAVHYPILWPCISAIIPVRAVKYLADILFIVRVLPLVSRKESIKCAPMALKAYVFFCR